MYRKLVIATAILAASSSVAFAGKNYKGDYKAEAAPCPSYSYMTGPYVGLSVGVRDNYSGTPTVYKGFEGTLSGGWGFMFSPMFYLAGEIFVGDSANIKDFKEETGTGDGVRSSWNYGVSIIPGMMITDHVLAYVRVGGTWTNFTEAHNHGSSTDNKGAWQVGVGGQTNVFQNWDVRAEYIYSGYGKVTKSIGNVGADQFNVGVVYKFI